MSIKFANNAFGTLNAGISSSDTSITLSSGQGARFPALLTDEYFYITLIDTSNNLEVVKCTARSTDVLTIVRAQDNTTARAFVIGDRVELRVTAAALEDSSNPYDKDTSSTGSFALPVGTTAQEPAAADSEGHIRYNSDDNVVYFSNGTDWVKVSSVVPILSSISGSLYNGAASTLTLTGTGFLTANLVVNFTQSSDSIDEDVTVTPASDTSATVNVPAAVYNNVTTGNAVSITVTNSDNIESAALTTTAIGLPSGGTVTTYSTYRVHTFTSSGTFTVPTGFSASADILLVAGGGGGAQDTSGGGGAGGMLEQTSVSISASSNSIVVGAGGNKANSSRGYDGADSTGLGYTAVGGGGGAGSANAANAGSGGSGGGGGGGRSAGSGTSGQGFAGQTASGAAGGGGAAEVGGTDGSGQGGDGRSNSYRTGSAVTYAGGGGGRDSGTSYAGGAGGGGGGSTSFAASVLNGSANTGGGGGGYYGSWGGAGNGGSGIVVIRYQP